MSFGFNPFSFMADSGPAWVDGAGTSVGGVCAMVGGLTGMPCHWMAGDVDLQTFLAVEGGLVIVAIVWAGVTLRLLHRGRKLRSR